MDLPAPDEEERALQMAIGAQNVAGAEEETPPGPVPGETEPGGAPRQPVGDDETDTDMPADRGLVVL